MRAAFSALTAVVLVAPLAAQEEKVFSGPQPGEKITPFKVLQVHTVEDVKEVEIGKTKKGEVTVLAFLHKLTEPSLGVFIWAEWFTHKTKGVNGHYVMLTGDRGKTEAQVKRWWARGGGFFAEAPMSISLDGIEGPGDYGLNRNVAMTVLVCTDNKVVKNFALEDPNAADAQKIINAVAKLIDKKPLTIAQIRSQRRAWRNKEYQARIKKDPLFKAAPDEKLGQLMMSMRSPGEGQAAQQRGAKRIAGQMREWAGDNAERLAALEKYCKFALKEFEFNRYSAAELKKIVGDK